eukprot:Clim_evm13s250 gene=Clim_evmTU13s250
MSYLTDVQYQEATQLVQRLRPGKQVIYFAAVAKLYKCNPGASSFRDTGRQGVLCWVKDFTLRSFVIRFADLRSGQIVFEQEVYPEMDYEITENLFHQFSSDDCVIGLAFLNESEASRYGKTVLRMVQKWATNAANEGRDVNEFPIFRKNGGGPTAARAAGGAAALSSLPIKTVNKNLSTSASSVKSKGKDKKKKKKDKKDKKGKGGGLSAGDISGPSNFQHVKHIGREYNQDDWKGLENWKDVFVKAGLKAEDMNNPETRQFAERFVQQHMEKKAQEQQRKSLEASMGGAAAVMAASTAASGGRMPAPMSSAPPPPPAGQSAYKPPPPPAAGRAPPPPSSRAAPPPPPGRAPPPPPSRGPPGRAAPSLPAGASPRGAPPPLPASRGLSGGPPPPPASRMPVTAASPPPQSFAAAAPPPPPQAQKQTPPPAVPAAAAPPPPPPQAQKQTPPSAAPAAGAPPPPPPMPAAGGAPPPPPMPAAGAAGSGSPAGGRADLLASIQGAGIGVLKKTEHDPEERRPVSAGGGSSGGGRDDLLSAIRGAGGLSALKKVDPEELAKIKPQEEEVNDLASALMSALAVRNKAMDSSSDDSDDDDDEDWDD